AKRVQELAGVYYARDYGMKVSIVRPFNAYGANYPWTSVAEAQVVPSLVKRVLDDEDPLIVWGSGNQRRNLLHGSDAARLMVMVVEKEIVATPVNIGYDEDTRIADLVALICEVTGRHPTIVFDTTKPEGAFRKSGDPARLNQISENYVPRVSLREGV